MKATRVAVLPLVVGAVLLLVAGEARGECAWVLWLEHRTPSTTKTSAGRAMSAVYWTPVTGFQSPKACEAEANTRTTGVVGGKQRVPAGALIAIEVDDETYAYHCLPDTVDPRK